MLKIFPCIGEGLPCGFHSLGRNTLRFQSFRATISTNTAINKSLRRSQSEPERFGRRRLGRSDEHNRDFLHRPQPGEWTRRPNHQEKQDSQDIEQHTRINERYKELKQARTTKRIPKALKDFARESVARGQTADESLREARYDYTRKAGGNRATRRAATFGHEIEPSEAGQSIAAKRRAAHRQSLSRNKDQNPPGRVIHDSKTLQDDVGEVGRKLALPEEFHDEQSTRSPGRPFTMGWQAQRAPGFPDRLSSGSHGKDFPQSNDQTARYRESEAPMSMPYTTPASEFLYGTSVVVAALLSSRRKIYKLYIYDGDNREVRDQDTKIRTMAHERGVVVQRVKGDWLRLMDKMSAGRPHNGYILEASPLPKLPVIGLQPVSQREGPFHLILDHQSREDEEINGKDTNIKYDVPFSRYPFVLLLDGVLDPGNLGAILRTAFFLGVDVVAIANRSSAPISPVALKASAGATENLPLVSVDQPGRFLDQCKTNGWKIYAAASPGSYKRPNSDRYLSASALGSPIRENPCVLVLGAEGEGLRWDIQKKANFDVGIEGQRLGQGKVDSLNVSVAAGLLCEAFLRKPSEADIAVNGALDALVPNNGPGKDSENLLF